VDTADDDVVVVVDVIALSIHWCVPTPRCSRWRYSHSLVSGGCSHRYGCRLLRCLCLFLVLFHWALLLFVPRWITPAPHHIPYAVIRVYLFVRYYSSLLRFHTLPWLYFHSAIYPPARFVPGGLTFIPVTVYAGRFVNTDVPCGDPVAIVTFCSCPRFPC